MKWAFSLSENRIDTIRHALAKRLHEAATLSGGGGSTGVGGFIRDSSRSGVGVLRDHVLFSTPHLPSGPGGQDAFEQYWNQSQPLSTPIGTHALPSAMLPSDGARLSSVMAGGGINYTGRTSSTSWDNTGAAWLGPGPTINSVPANKFGRGSPEEIDIHQAHGGPQLRASPQGSSASSSSEFIRPNANLSHSQSHSQSSLPVQHSASYRPQRHSSGFEPTTYNAWTVAGTDLHAGVVGSGASASFIEIDASGTHSRTGSYPPPNSYSSSTHHDPHGAGAASEYGASQNAHSDPNFLGAADSYLGQLNRTRFHPPEFDPSYNS